jgi:hypothetical protein
MVYHQLLIRYSVFVRWWRKMDYNGRGHSEDLGMDGNIILEFLVGKFGGKVWTGCIWLLAVVNTVMNLQIPQMAGNF